MSTEGGNLTAVENPMNELINISSEAPRPPAATSFVCRIRRKQERDGRPSSSDAGEVELENLSSTPIEIELEMSPFQHLNLVVTDSEGAVVSDGHYGNRFSPLAERVLWRLQPGQKYTHTVSLLGTVPVPLRPGVYTVRAVYQYKTLKAVSEPLIVELPMQR
jgi:hypothetical protein